MDEMVIKIFVYLIFLSFQHCIFHYFFHSKTDEKNGISFLVLNALKIFIQKKCYRKVSPEKSIPVTLDNP